jgi:sugar transferase (PEP-CTERM/EpsH1 system associated)
MRILYVAHRIPYPPNKGDKIRSFQQIKHFSQNHHVHLAAFYDDPQDLKHLPALQEFCEEVKLLPLLAWRQRFKAAKALLSGEPWTLGYFHRAEMAQTVGQLLRSYPFDLLFAYSSSVAPYLMEASPPKVVDFVDSDASKWKQYADFHRFPKSYLFALEAAHLGEFERSLVKRFDASVFVAPREVTHIEDQNLREKIRFIQNGVDLEFFQPSVRGAAAPVIIFTGAMDYLPNVDAVRFYAEAVFPVVRSRFPAAQFLVVGSQPAPAVLRLSRLPRVTVVGAVPDVRPYLAEAAVAVAPLRISQGIQNKVLEALASGLPVVASPLAANGIARVGELPIRVANSAEEFGERTIQLLAEGPLSEEQVSICRVILAENYNWGRNLSAFDDLFAELSRAACQSATRRTRVAFEGGASAG